VLAVMLGVVTAGLGMMLFGMAGMAVSGMGVVGGLLVIAGLMVLGGFAMMLGGMFVVFGSLMMVLDACVVAHILLSRSAVRSPADLRRSPDTMLTAARQACCSRACTETVSFTETLPSSRRFRPPGRERRE
jgi:hypothetical protein